MKQLKLPFKPMSLREKAIDLLKLSISFGHPNFKFDESCIKHFIYYLENGYNITVSSYNGYIDIDKNRRSPE